jgi:hypothetical protein
VVVPRSSAVVPGTPDVEAIALHKDHRGLTLFLSEDDDDFRTVAGQVQLLVRDSAPAVEQRWEEHRLRGMRSSLSAPGAADVH